MSSIETSLIVFACVLASALLGMSLRKIVPQPHLNGDSRAIVQAGMGLVGTLTALALGLLISSAKGFYDSQVTELTHLSADSVLLDRVLAHYGSETQESRDLLRGAVVDALDQIWSKSRSAPSLSIPRTNHSEILYDKIQQLSPKDDGQRQLKSQALSMVKGLGQIHWLMYEQKSYSPSPPMLVILVFWLMALFLSFGLFAPTNATVVTSLFVSALSVSSAILLVLEMYTPYAGLIHVSTTPLRTALANLGQ
jgi:hypothetical protein